MKTPRHILAKIIAEKTMNITDSKVLAREIAAYLLAEGRTRELESILRDIMQYRSNNGTLEAEIVSAHELSPEMLEEVNNLLRARYPKAKKLHIKSRLEKAVVGGLRIDMANEQLDMTIASKLAKFKQITLARGNK